MEILLDGFKLQKQNSTNSNCNVVIHRTILQFDFM